MVDYERMYHKMANAATDVNRQLTEMAIIIQTASLGIIKAQQECEERYIEGAEDDPDE